MASKLEVENFIKDIKPEDKINLIFHNDLDGFASGILFYDYLKDKGCKDIGIYPFVIINGNLKDIKENLRDRDKLIILDLAKNTIHPKITELLQGEEVLYIDHHKTDSPLENKNILEYRITERYTPCSRIVYELIDGKEWLSVAGTISDYGDRYPENKEFIEGFLKKNNYSSNKYLEDVVTPLSYLLIAFEKNLKMAFEIIKDIKDYDKIENLKKYSKPVYDEINQSLENSKKYAERIKDINFYYFNPKFLIRSIIVNKISEQNPEEIYIFASPENGKIGISARCQSKKIDMIEILKKSAKDLKDSSCGGHSAAAGGYIQKEDLEKFRKNLSKI